MENTNTNQDTGKKETPLEEKGEADTLGKEGGLGSSNATESDELAKKEREKTRVNKILFLENFVAGKGVVEKICEKIGIHKSTYYRWLEKDAVFVADLKKLQTRYNDEAEDVLRQLVFLKKDPGSVKFYLQSKHPDYKKRIINEIVPVGNKTAKEVLDEFDREVAALKEKENERRNNTTGNTRTSESDRISEGEVGVSVSNKEQEGGVATISPEQSPSVLLEEKDKKKSNSEESTKGNLKSYRRGPAPRLHSERHQ